MTDPEGRHVDDRAVVNDTAVADGQPRAASNDGLYRPSGDIYHGTPRAYDTIRLPSDDMDLPRHGGDEYGRGFYTAHDAASPDAARTYAARYAEEAGLVVRGQLNPQQFALLNLETPLGENLSQQLRTQLSTVATGDPDLDRYYRHVASRLDANTSGRMAWERLSGVNEYESWYRQEHAVDMDRSTATRALRSDRGMLRTDLQAQGIDLSDSFVLDEPQAARVQEGLRRLNPENPVMQRYYQQLAETVRPGMQSTTVVERMMDEAAVQRTAAAMAPEIDRTRMAGLLDARGTTILNNVGADGIYVPHDQTVVFKGQASIDRLPDLRVVDIVGTGPMPSNILTERMPVVGEVMIPSRSATEPLPASRTASVLPEGVPGDSARELRWTTGRRDGVVYTDVFIEPGMDADRIIADLGRDGVPATRTTMTYPAHPDVPLEVVRVEAGERANNFRRLQSLGADLNPITPPPSIDAQLRASAEPEIPVDRRAPDSPMRDRPEPATMVDERDRFPRDGVLRDNFGRELTTDPRTGKPQDPIITSRNQYNAQLAENDAFRASQADRARFGEYGSWDGIHPADGRPELRTTSQVNPLQAEAPSPRQVPIAANDGNMGRIIASETPIMARDVAPGIPAAAAEPRPPVMPDAPELPRGRTITGGRALGAATVVLTAGMPIIEGLMTQRTDAGETRGEAIGRAYRHAPENLVRAVAAPIVSLTEGDGTMAAAQTLQLATMIDAPGWVQLMRSDAVARGIPQADVDRFSTALPPGNMNLGSRDAALNQIAQLIAYREQGVEHLMVGTNIFSAGVKVYGPGAPGMPMAEGMWVTSTDSLLNEQVRLYIANGGTATAIMEATDPQYYREQVYNRLRTTVPDNAVPGYQHYPIEARAGMQQLEQFRAGIQADRDMTPEGRAQLIDLANEYLRVRDFDEADALNNARYQYNRLGFTIPRPEEFVAAGMGGVFGVTGRPEDFAADIASITRVLNTAVGADETIRSRIRIGSDFSANTQEVFAALPPDMQAQATAESARLAAIAPPAPVPAPAPAPVVAPEPPVEETPIQTIVVTGNRYPQAPTDDEVSSRLSRVIRDNGLTAFIDSDQSGTIEFGELRSKLRDAGVTIADSGRVSTDQLQQALPALQTLRDESASRS